MKRGTRVLANGDAGAFIEYDYNKHDDKVAIVVTDNMPGVQQVFDLYEVSQLTMTDTADLCAIVQRSQQNGTR